MPYNPGITARGEILGQSIGAAGQSIAQSYGQGLRLQEEQKRFDDQQNLVHESYEKQAELLGLTKKQIRRASTGELMGLVEGTKAKQRFDYEGLYLQRLQDDIEQTESGKRAIGQMQMYMEEQNLPAVDAATTAASDLGLELGEAAKLLNLATTGQKLGLELQQIQQRGRELEIREEGQEISEGTLDVQKGQLKLQQDELERRKNPPQPKARAVEGAPGYKVIDMGGGKSQLVETEAVEEDTTQTGGLTQAQVGKVITQLKKLKATGETHGTVTSKGVVKGSKYLTNDDPIDELIQKYELMQKDSDQLSEAEIRKQADEAIKSGADLDAVRKAVKERYGIDL